MKPITVNVSESTYREFKEQARRQDRKTAELIREAMEFYREKKIREMESRSLRELQSESVGRILTPLESDNDILGEMIHL
ncbi:MAG: ribbon-helix-helix protein, CopG family [Opitutales bacterium]|nr:ribbon-helix-helix protein, CopG family [Opitutales bacterium]